MKKETSGLFKIIKHSWFWLFTSLLLIAGSIILFIVNARLSIEFTGGIELQLDQIQNEENLVSSLEKGLIAQGFVNPQVNIEQSDTSTNLFVSLDFKDDEQVKEVSSGVNNILLNDGFIASSDNIV